MSRPTEQLRPAERLILWSLALAVLVLAFDEAARASVTQLVLSP
jgi:hypothetical protein